MIHLFSSHCMFVYGCIGCDPSGRAVSGGPRLMTSARSGFLSGMNCRDFVLLSFMVVEPLVLRRVLTWWITNRKYSSNIHSNTLTCVRLAYHRYFQLICCTTYIKLLTPRCRVLPEQLTGLQLVKKFPAFHGTRRFITALTSVHHLSLLRPKFLFTAQRLLVG